MTMEREEKEKDRDRERQRDSRGREKERDKEREKVKLKEKEKDRDLEKKERGGTEQEKDRAHDKEKDRDRGKDKERSSKDLEKEKDRDRDREREKNREKDHEREKDRLKDQEREKDRAKDQDREKDRTKDQEREKDRTKDLEREKDRTNDQERDRKKEREKEKRREHSKKDEDREKEKDKEKEKKRERERPKERERDDNDREKERERNGRGKERERDLREKERERDKEWDKEREKENEREKEKDYQKSRGAREKERDIREKEQRDNDRDNNNNRHRDWTEKDRERETEKEHEADKAEKQNKRDDKDRASKEAHGSRPSASELEERIAKMREERHKGYSEQRSSAKKADADDDDMNAWVNKSRKIEQRKKIDDRQKAARMAKILAEQDNEEDDNSGDEFNNSGYGGKDLAGLKVRHGFDKVMEGHAVVLTLKDTSVLDGDDVNEAGDELENIEMAEQQARQDAYKAAKKKPGSYEDKFGNDMDALVTERTILPQYDDVVKDEGVILDINGGLSEESKKRLEEVRLRLEGASAKESLGGSSAKPISDYYTEEDMLQFRKPKKKKKLRKKDKIDIDQLEAEAVAAGLGAEDLGSRDSEGRRAQRQADEKAKAEARKNAYQNALSKAEDASMVLRKENTVEPMEVDKTESPVYVGDEDEDFYKSLDRARQAALQNQRNPGNTGSGPQSVVARLAALQQEAVSSSRTQSGAETQEGGLVFTDTGEFCRSLQLDDAIIKRAGPKDVFGEEEEEVAAEEMEIETIKVEGGWTEVVDEDKTYPVGEEETDGEPVDEPIAEVSVGKGLAGALSLLKERGTLKETVDWGGRNMDKKRSKLVGIVDESNNQVGQRDILLDRMDEFGRTMTPKEAFRKLSHKFHGKGPGKMKQEKKMKQYQEELRLKQMNSGDTPLMSMEKMREAQARMHTPYIVISGHIKPGQTSDPRSGFGTVEKEPIGSLTPMLGDKSAGSLTPMLGDKKVEHFLGIKRKPDSGFKEPPPKQPKFEH